MALHKPTSSFWTMLDAAAECCSEEVFIEHGDLLLGDFQFQSDDFDLMFKISPLDVCPVVRGRS
jgi:hypothetical protein